jgi:hypothetical protein
MMQVEYIETGTQQLGLDKLKVAESLEVTVINSSTLFLTNPTPQPVSVVYVLSDNQLVWNGRFEVEPFSSAPLPLSMTGGSIYKVATMRGNIFSAGLDYERTAVSEQAWHVTFRVNSTVPLTPSAWNDSAVVGETYWYNVNLNWEWNFTSKVFGNQSVPAGTCVGFIATTTLVKVVDDPDNATINYLIDTGDSNFDKSMVAFIIDGVLMRPLTSVVWYDSSHYVWFTLQGAKYSSHDVIVLFYGKDVDVQKLSLNVVNATFAP